MSAINLGRRYERLLWAAAPITLAAIFLAFIAIASTTQDDHVMARCYERAALELSSDASLTKAWLAAQPVTDAIDWGLGYRMQLTIGGLGELEGDCSEVIEKELQAKYRASPADIAKQFTAEAKTLAQTPLDLYGIEVPETATIVLMGTAIKINLTTLSRVLQITFAPILILWLGSLHNTRFRETRLISEAKGIEEIFPHIVNIYPVTKLPELRRKSYLASRLPMIVTRMYLVLRIILILLFVGPSVAAYEIGLFYLMTDSANLLFLITGTVVAMFGLSQVVVECQQWNIGKIFPGPELKL